MPNITTNHAITYTYLAPFLPEFLRVYQSNSVRGSRLFFLGFPNDQPLLPSAFGKRLRFHRFL